MRPKFLIALALLIALAGGALWWGLRRRAEHGFSQLWELYSYSSNVVATAYESPRGGATVIWVSGADGLMNPWGQVWDVYSFTNSITANVYNSPHGGATIIWMSGADDLPRAPTNAIAASPRKPKPASRKAKP